MLKVLVTNDDGIESVGLKALVEALAEHADVYVVAPEDQQSAKSHSITFHGEVSAAETELRGAVEARILSGTPTDCVIWGLGWLAKEGIKPDFVFSGINMGYNTGFAIYYSGTVAAAREAALNGIRSIALSVGDHDAKFFDYLLGLLPRFMEMSRHISAKTVLNVNAPNIPSWDIKGVRVTEAAPYGYGVSFGFNKTDSGDYKIGGYRTFTDDRMRYDIDWVTSGYVSVSPLPTALTDHAALLRLRGQMAQAECLTVIVDAQQQMLGRVKKPERFADNITRLAHAVSRMGMPLLFTETGGMGDILPELEAYAGGAEKAEHIQPDAWSSPDMEKLVSLIDVERVLIAGAASNIELLQTALGFRERGYDVTVIEDCCAAAKKSDHRVAMKDLEDAGCRVSTMGTEVMQLASSCTKQVLDSVKNILFT